MTSAENFVNLAREYPRDIAIQIISKEIGERFVAIEEYTRLRKQAIKRCVRKCETCAHEPIIWSGEKEICPYTKMEITKESCCDRYVSDFHTTDEVPHALCGFLTESHAE